MLIESDWLSVGVGSVRLASRIQFNLKHFLEYVESYPRKM